MKKFNLTKEFVVFTPEKIAAVVPNTPELYGNLDEQFDSFHRHELIACHEFESNWPSWEIHPHGDEIVMLMEGSATFILDVSGQHQEINLSVAGEYVIVPKGVWHTAHIAEWARMLFITPGQGTLNKSIQFAN